MAKEQNIDFLGRVPIDPKFTTMVDVEGSGSYVHVFEQSSLFPIFQQVCNKITEKVSSA
jgi:hypothetical protein